MEKNISKIPTLIEDEKSSGGKDIKVLNKQGRRKERSCQIFPCRFPFTFNSTFNSMFDIFLTF